MDALLPIMPADAGIVRYLVFSASLREGSLTAAVKDAGSWNEDSARSQRAGRGRGFAMMEQLMDRVEVDHSHLGTCVVLHKELRVLARPDALG